MKEKVKIQINSIEALERMIGGDSEIEFQIRNNIVQDFATRHLKAIANDVLLKKLATAVGNEISDTLVEEIPPKERIGWNVSYQYRIKPQAKISLQQNVSDIINQLVHEEVQKQLDILNITSEIKKTLEKQVDYITKELASENLRIRLDAMVSNRLKEMLKIK